MDGDVRTKDGVELKVTYSTIDQPGPPEDPGGQQEQLGGDRLRGHPQPGRRRHLLRQRRRQRPEHQPLLRRHPDVHQRPDLALPAHLHAVLVRRPGRRATSPRSRTAGPGRTTPATPTPSTTPSTKQAATETDAEQAAELFIQMNDILINDVVDHPAGQPRGREVRDPQHAARRRTSPPASSKTLYWNSPTGTASANRRVSTATTDANDEPARAVVRAGSRNSPHPRPLSLPRERGASSSARVLRRFPLSRGRERGSGGEGCQASGTDTAGTIALPARWLASPPRRLAASQNRPGSNGRSTSSRVPSSAPRRWRRRWRGRG